MPYVLVAVLAAVVLILALAACAGRGSAPAPPASAPAADRASPPAEAAPSAREALRARLRRLAESPPPTDLSLGAMCYKTAGPPDRVEYVCPKCGERTVYARSGSPAAEVRPASWEISQLVEEKIAECRRRVQGLRGAGVRIDESEFCHACSPDTREPRLALVVRHAGETADIRTVGVSPEDVALVAEFLNHETKHTLGRDAEEPLKNHVKRIAELLGLEAAETK
jgi:predicted RNA-binding Zn-ribbon protein involved in translation (DUF1610 family)